MIACLVVSVSRFLLIECVLKVMRKELLERSNKLLPFFFQCISFVIINYLLEIEIFSKKIPYRKKILVTLVILQTQAHFNS